MESVHKSLNGSEDKTTSAAKASEDKNESLVVPTGSKLLTTSQEGINEPPSTPANNENKPVNMEKVENESLVEAPAINAASILDVTLPYNKPNTPGIGTIPEDKTTSAKI
jgi:hypothetical protein